MFTLTLTGLMPHDRKLPHCCTLSTLHQTRARHNVSPLTGATVWYQQQEELLQRWGAAEATSFLNIWRKRKKKTKDLRSLFKAIDRGRTEALFLQFEAKKNKKQNRNDASWMFSYPYASSTTLTAASKTWLALRTVTHLFGCDKNN